MKTLKGGRGPWYWELSDEADPSVGIFGGDTFTVYLKTREREEEVDEFYMLMVGSQLEAELYCQALNDGWRKVREAEDAEYERYLEEQAKVDAAEREWERRFEDNEP